MDEKKIIGIINEIDSVITIHESLMGRASLIIEMLEDVHAKLSQEVQE